MPFPDQKSLSKHFSQLFGQFLRQVEDQFRLQHLLQEIIVVPVVGIEVLAADDLEYASLALVPAAAPDGVQRIVEAQVTETIVKKKDPRVFLDGIYVYERQEGM